MQRSERVEKYLNEFHTAIFAWPCVLSDRLPVLCSFLPGVRWDAVGMNCKTGATAEYKGADVMYMD